MAVELPVHIHSFPDVPLRVPIQSGNRSLLFQIRRGPNGNLDSWCPAPTDR